MKIYLLLIFILTILYLFLKRYKKGKEIFLLISFFVLFLLLALRNESIGTDVKTYHSFFDYFSKYNLDTLLKSNYFEKGYVLYNYIVYVVTNGNFRIFIIITAFLSLFGVYSFIKRYSSDYLLSVITYICFRYYTFANSGLRQAIALSIVCFAFHFIEERKMIKYIILVFIASLFHVSALIALPAYFLKNFKLNNSKVIWSILFIGFVYIFRQSIVGLFAKNFFNSYTLVDNYGGGYTLLFLYIFLFIVVTLFKKKIFDVNDKNLSVTDNTWYNFMYVGILVQILATVEGNAYRATLYYLMSFLCIIPEISNVFQKKYRYSFNLMIIIMLTLFFCLTSSKLNYEFYWS